jgi:hypothetical protein
MSCNHKFQNELNLELIDYEPTTLIVGTFNPELPTGNPAEWFFGRTTSNYFWNILPRLYGEASLINATADDWKQFCRNKQIAITDLISSIDDAQLDNKRHYRALAGFSDDAIEYNFDDFSFVNITRILQQQPTIKNVYFTRGITDAFWRHLWNPAMQYCNRNGLHERRLLTPTDGVSYQYETYNDEHPGKLIPRIEDYILVRWREEWHF